MKVYNVIQKLKTQYPTTLFILASDLFTESNNIPDPYGTKYIDYAFNEVFIDNELIRSI